MLQRKLLQLLEGQLCTLEDSVLVISGEAYSLAKERHIEQGLRKRASAGHEVRLSIEP